MKRALAIAASALAGTVLVLALAIPWLVVPVITVPEVQPGSSAPPELAVGTSLESGVRSFPLVPAGGVVDREFAGGTELGDSRRVETALLELGARLGLDPGALAYMLEVQPTYPQQQGDHVYPYAYSPFDAFVGMNLTVPDTDDGRRAVIDLTTLMTALAVRSDRATWAGALAYSVLRQASALRETCDSQLQLTFLVTRGIETHYDDVAAEVETAERLCPRDPTPRWLLAQFAATQAVVTDEIRTLDRSAAERRQLAETAFADLRTRFPDSPVGWAGTADLYLRWADSSERFGSAPFQVRQWRREALELYRATRQRFTDPRLAVGEARALSALGDHGQATQLVDAAARALPGSLPTAIVRSDVLSDAGDHDAAADAIATERVQPAWWLATPPPFRPNFMTGAYAAEQLPDIVLMDAAMNQFGGAGTNDLSFLPRHRHSRIDHLCRGGKRLEELLLAHRDAEVSRLLHDGTALTQIVPGLQCDTTPDSYLVDYFTADDLATLVKLDRGETVGAKPVLQDRWQDLLRSAGQWPQARDAAQRWTTAEPENGAAWQRLGEVAFWTTDDRLASTAFERAASSLAFESAGETSDDAIRPGQYVAWSQLQRGAVSERAGDEAVAATWYHQALASAAQGTGGYWSDYVTVHALSQLGRRALLDGRQDEAVDELREAIRTGARHDEQLTTRYDPDASDQPAPVAVADLGANSLLHGAQHSNLALACARSGDDDAAVDAARAAVGRDPSSPIFVDTLAFALQAQGASDEAVDVYRDALARDGTAYVSANNLAVLLAQHGRAQDARDVLGDVVSSRPEYATAWHNLGVVDQSSWSASAYLQSQGELGRAAHLSPALRDAEPVLLPDQVIYDSGVDVSRPVPADWQYAASASAPTTHWTIALVALLVLRLVVMLLNEVLGGRLSEWMLEYGPQAVPAWLLAEVAGPVAVLITIAALVGRSLLLTPGLAAVVSLLATAAMVVVAVAVRAALDPGSRQTTTTAAVGVAVLGGAVGVPFAPFPSSGVPTGTVRRGALLVAPGLVALVLVACTTAVVATGVPMARGLALAAVTLLSSIFVAVPPMDGSNIKGRLLNVSVSVGLLVATVMYGIPLV